MAYCWRLSRYESQLRMRDSPWESWIGYSDVGQVFNGIVLTAEEYVRVENLYIDAVTRFALDASAELFTVARIGHQTGSFSLFEGQTLLRSDLAPVVRGNLRETLDCTLEDVQQACQIEFGYDLYMGIAATAPCERAVAETAWSGLHVEVGVPLGVWEN